MFVHCRPSRSKRIPRPQPRPWRLGKLFTQVFLCLHLLQFYCHIVCLAGLRGATICQSYSCLINTPGNMMSKHLEMFGTFPLLFNLVFAQEVKSSRKRHFLFLGSLSNTDAAVQYAKHWQVQKEWSPKVFYHEARIPWQSCFMTILSVWCLFSKMIVFIQWFSLQRMEKYPNVLQDFFCQYRLKPLHWRQCNNSSQYRLQVLLSIV